MLKNTASSFRPVQLLVPGRGKWNMKISREELYRRVWETPVRTLAKEFDISDVGLAKTCRKLEIPLPPVGHWMKVQHGKVVKQPALPPSDTTDVVIASQPHRLCKPSLAEAQALATKVVDLDFTIPARALNLAPFAAATLKELQTPTPDARGLVTCTGPKVFNCTVSPATAARTARLLHAVEMALPQLNAKVSVAAARDNAHAGVVYEGTTVRFRVTEAYTRAETRTQHSKHAWDYTKTFKYHLSGRLTFEIEEWFDGQKRWSDTARHSVEDKLGGFILSLVVAAKAVIKREFEWAEEKRLREEAKRQSEERARLIREEQEFRRQLLDEAALWQKCDAVRQYLDHVRERLASSKQEMSQNNLDWLTHAELALADMLPLEKRLAPKDGTESPQPRDVTEDDDEDFEDSEY